MSKQTDTTDELMAINSDDSDKSSAPQAGWALLFSAWAIALAASLGALFIGEVLGQEPCNLCWYQRSAMFPLALMLGIACLYNDFSIRRYAVPLAITGGAVALWHTLLYVGLISEAIVPCSVNGPSCTDANMTILGVIPLPMISLASFIVIALLLTEPDSNDDKKSKQTMNRRTLVLGTVAAAAGVFGVGALLFQKNQTPLDSTPVVGKDTPLIRSYAPVMGNKDAPVTIVEFFDPACEACRAFHPVVKEILDQYPEQVRVVLRYAAFHEGSDEAVGILEAARLQGKFEPVLEALLDAQPQWANHGAPRIDLAWDAAVAVGLDVQTARSDMQSAEIVKRIEQDQADVQTVRVRQTPTFFVDGRPLLQFGADELREMVRLQVEAKK